MLSVTSTLLLSSLALIVLTYAIVVYNSLVALRQNIHKASSNIDVLLEQRFDEVPRLVECVKGYMKHEADVFQTIATIRGKFLRAKEEHKIQEQMNADEELTGFMKELFVLAEQYPTLRASKQFEMLMARISELEVRIADRREFYNENVNRYNTRLEVFPDLLIAKLFRYRTKALFVIENGKRENSSVGI